MGDAAPLVRMRNIRKRFGEVEVLCGVDLDVYPNEVHILAGENGAGKSTLMKILGGVHTNFDGTIDLADKPFQPRSPLHANELGIAVIYQELSLVPAMSVADNIYLGRTLTSAGGFVRASQQRDGARKLLDKLGMSHIDVDAAVERLSIGTQQMVEIAKSMVRDARVIVMDEPTSALSAPEVERLFALIASLKSRGCAIIYITHKMEEIERIADRITVLRDGKYVGSAPARELPVPKLIRWMVGRDVEQQFPRHATEGGDVRLSVNNFTVKSGAKTLVNNVSFTAKKGEIVGIGGLQGSGASELLLGLFGAYGSSNITGQITLDNKPFHPTSPRHSIACGFAEVTSDRKASGLVLSMNIIENTTLPALDRLSPLGWRSAARERNVAQQFAESLNLRCASLTMETASLSGGNQQKVVLAKWLATDPKILLLDEPTRGIDVGAKREIYQLMNEWTARGITILLITSELPELLAMSDRIIILHRGQLTAEFTRQQATADAILQAAMGRAA
jgi:ribose transport system ATP-binding protein